MRININSLRGIGATALLAVAVGVTGCQSNRDRTTGQAINDKMTAFNVNHALSSDPVLKFPDVKVHVYNGNAQLTGFVDSEDQRNRAAEIASGVPGVSQVINEITIKPTPTGRAIIRDPLKGHERLPETPAPNTAPEPPPPPR
ncbi:MAG TPA: BON domain-containing protein [Verrucomicrobiae bacterium]|jgi:hypothetical protein|nr:BON domain-containing protein [Verrucomicrobiae bacterium]